MSAIRSHSRYKNRRTLSGTFLSLLFVLGLAAPSMGGGQGLATEYVVLMCVDGIRNLECFKNADASPLGETPSYHPYIPRIWSEMAPTGTLYSNCVTTEASFTTPGFHTLITGDYQAGPNRARRENFGFFDNRAEAPSIFEYFKKATGRTAWGVINKKNSLLADYSVHPMGGKDLGANFVFVDPGRGANRYQSDTEVFSAVVQVIEDEQPDLMFINYGAVDLSGHSGSHDTYVQAIQSADTYVADTWQLLQSSPKYQGKTTLILTTDHGRHSDAYGGFASHGGMCPGCRDLALLVIGPDTPEGQVVSRRTYQNDVGSTIGRFMGFETPFATGRILEEAFGLPAQEHILLSRKPFAASEGDSNVFMALERRRNGKQQMHVGISRDKGETFTAALNLSSFDGSEYASVAKDPLLLVNRRNGTDLLQAFWLDLADSEGRWELKHRLADLTQFQQGAELSFNEEVMIADSIFEGERVTAGLYNTGLILQTPHVVSTRGPNGRREIVVTAGQRFTMGFRFSDNAFADGGQGNTQSMFPTERFFFYEPHMATSDKQDLYVVWRDIFSPVWTDLNGDSILDPLHNWDVFFSSSNDGGETWTLPAVRITRSLGATLHPCIALAPIEGLTKQHQLFVVYSDQDSNGIYQIYMRRALLASGGGTPISFTPAVAMTQSTVGAWYPQILVDRPISGNGIHLVYTDFAHGNGDILYRFSDTGDQFSPPLNLSDSPEISQKPTITVMDDGRKFVAWESILDGTGRSAIRHKSFTQVFPEVERE